MYIMCLAETNRRPFDLAEGESELVSGFNVEYMGGGFSLIMLSEYSRILFMRLMIVVLGLGSDLISFFFYLRLVILRFTFVWVRGSFPRIRYDRLMDFSWRSVLPLSLNFLVYYYGVLVLFDKIVV